MERQAGGVRSGLPQGEGTMMEKKKNAEASRGSKGAIGLNTYIFVGVLAIGLLLLNYIRSAFLSSGEKLGNNNNNEI